MKIAIILSVAINIFFAGYFIKQGQDNKLPRLQILKILLYNLTMLLFCILLYWSTKDLEIQVVTTCSILCMALQALSFLPLKSIFDGIIEQLNIEEEYEFLMRKEEMDQKYFAMMKEHEEHVARIRHDFINQVAVVSGMVENCDNNAVGMCLLDELREEVESTRTAVYCNNKMVNIVVDVMHNQYREKGVGLDVNIVLPDILMIDEMNVCSIIQTLLNAMLSIVQLMEKKERRVEFQVKKKKELLVFAVKCRDFELKERKQYDKIVKSYTKYFEKILESRGGNVYNREENHNLDIMVTL